MSQLASKPAADLPAAAADASDSAAPASRRSSRHTPSTARGIPAFVELAKPRITRLVTLTSAVGFALGVLNRGWSTSSLLIVGLGALIGTALSSAGANALNQWMEQHRDARMNRTKGRPIPSGRVHTDAALAVSIGLCIAGVGLLLALCGPWAAGVSLATILIYLLIYTPLKPITTLNTLVGAVPGAMPPLIGWAAARNGFAEYGGLLEAPGWTLFLLMFVWQIPHFLAIAWMYREDYARGGYRMLPIADPTGSATSWAMLMWAIVLVPVSLAPALAMPERFPLVYPLVAVISGLAYVALAFRSAQLRTSRAARTVFFASIAHLPLLLIVLVADAALPSI